MTKTKKRKPYPKYHFHKFKKKHLTKDEIKNKKERRKRIGKKARYHLGEWLFK